MSNSRERIQNAINFKRVDKLPVRIYAAPGGYYAHGQKLHELLCACGHDFGPVSEFVQPEPIPASDYDAEGNYYSKSVDEWGVEWEFRIPGIQGHPSHYPLADWDALSNYKVPPLPDDLSKNLAQTISNEKELRKEYYRIGFTGTYFERLSALRPFEEVLIDVTLGDENICRLADMIFARGAEIIDKMLQIGYDSIFIGDDYGTATGPLISPDAFKEFFYPRYKALFDPVHQNSKNVFMHSCGNIDVLLTEFRKMGVDVIWPQITNWEFKDLASKLKDLGLAIELHPDRGDMMQHGSAEQVREYVKRLIDVFEIYEGGSWLYVEIEPGFKWETTEALITEIMKYR